jgi:hypothetical protein
MANRKFDPDGDGSTETNPQDVEQDEVTVANTAQEETMLVFRSFTPLEFNPDTGITPAGKKTSNALNGVYVVKMVNHKFSRGEFTQTLEAARELHINLRNVDLFENLRDVPEDTGADSTTASADTESVQTAQGGADTTSNPVNSNPSGSPLFINQDGGT